MGLITDEIIAEIRERTDIVHIVGEYVRLQNSGRTFKALCPFHQEKTPSFYVVPDKQIYHCFGCGRGGNVFKFLMEKEHCSFPEAVRFLGKRCGVHIPTDHDPRAEEKGRVFKMLEQVASFWRAQLMDARIGQAPREYLERRGLQASTIQTFLLGYAPPQWDGVLKRFGKDSASVDVLLRAGLIKAREDGSGHYDTFRGRLMIPICDVHGRIVAFGGRVLRAEDEPKYLNSPETEIFNKRKMLFNFKRAIPEIRRENAAIVVEGYLDVISLAQAGIGNVVATLGTAVTPEQIHALARNCDSVYFCYDADAAGQRATLGAISLQR